MRCQRHWQCWLQRWSEQRRKVWALQLEGMTHVEAVVGGKQLQVAVH